MSKHSKQDYDFSQKTLGFLPFWSFIASEIGDHRLEINSAAKRLDELFPPDSVHPEHLKKLVVNSLHHQNGRLNQLINLNSLLDALGETAYQLRKSGADDLFDIELLEEIAWHISTRFPHLIELSENQAAPGSQAANRKSEVLSMAKYKILQANKML